MNASRGDSTSDALVVLVTGPDRATMEDLARTLVEERLVACVNVVDGLRSIYRWEGAVAPEPTSLGSASRFAPQASSS